MARYDRSEWERRKPDLTGKANPDIRERLFRENVTFSQLAAWVGVTPSTIGLWLRKPLNTERRRRIEEAFSAMMKQRREVKE